MSHDTQADSRTRPADTGEADSHKDEEKLSDSKPKVDEEDDAVTCRICHATASESCPLIKPCKCSGSVGFAHEPCLVEWLLRTKRLSCDLCRANFRLTKVYNAGLVAPQGNFFRIATQAFFMLLQKTVMRVVRVAVVLLLWGVIVPPLVFHMITTQSWRGAPIIFDMIGGAPGPSSIFFYLVWIAGAFATCFLMLLIAIVMIWVDWCGEHGDAFPELANADMVMHFGDAEVIRDDQENIAEDPLDEGHVRPDGAEPVPFHSDVDSSQFAGAQEGAYLKPEDASRVLDILSRKQHDAIPQEISVSELFGLDGPLWVAAFSCVLFLFLAYFFILNLITCPRMVGHWFARYVVPLVASFLETAAMGASYLLSFVHAGMESAVAVFMVRAKVFALAFRYGTVYNTSTTHDGLVPAAVVLPSNGAATGTDSFIFTGTMWACGFLALQHAAWTLGVMIRWTRFGKLMVHFTTLAKIAFFQLLSLGVVPVFLGLAITALCSDLITITPVHKGVHSTESPAMTQIMGQIAPIRFVMNRSTAELPPLALLEPKHVLSSPLSIMVAVREMDTRSHAENVCLNLIDLSDVQKHMAAASDSIDPELVLPTYSDKREPFTEAATRCSVGNDRSLFTLITLLVHLPEIQFVSACFAPGIILLSVVVYHVHVIQSYLHPSILGFAYEHLNEIQENGIVIIAKRGLGGWCFAILRNIVVSIGVALFFVRTSLRLMRYLLPNYFPVVFYFDPVSLWFDLGMNISKARLPLTDDDAQHPWLRNTLQALSSPITLNYYFHNIMFTYVGPKLDLGAWFRTGVRPRIRDDPTFAVRFAVFFLIFWLTAVAVTCAVFSLPTLLGLWFEAQLTELSVSIPNEHEGKLNIHCFLLGMFFITTISRILLYVSSPFFHAIDVVKTVVQRQRTARILQAKLSAYYGLASKVLEVGDHTAQSQSDHPSGNEKERKEVRERAGAGMFLFQTTQKRPPPPRAALITLSADVSSSPSPHLHVQMHALIETMVEVRSKLDLASSMLGVLDTDANDIELLPNVVRNVAPLSLCQRDVEELIGWWEGHYPHNCWSAMILLPLFGMLVFWLMQVCAYFQSYMLVPVVHCYTPCGMVVFELAILAAMRLDTYSELIRCIFYDNCFGMRWNRWKNVYLSFISTAAPLMFLPFSIHHGALPLLRWLLSCVGTQIIFGAPNVALSFAEHHRVVSLILAFIIEHYVVRCSPAPPPHYSTSTIPPTPTTPLKGPESATKRAEKVASPTTKDDATKVVSPNSPGGERTAVHASRGAQPGYQRHKVRSILFGFFALGRAVKRLWIATMRLVATASQAQREYLLHVLEEAHDEQHLVGLRLHNYSTVDHARTESCNK